MKQQFRDFESTREFVRALNLNGQTEWREYCKSGKKPDDIPASPERTYKKQQTWTSWGDFLGTGRIANQNRVYRSYKEAREFVRALNLKDFKNWQEYCKSGKKPDDIPGNPNKIYKNEFKGVGDWLGTGRIAMKDKQFRSFQEAREFVRALNLKNQKEWELFSQSDKCPKDIPSRPDDIYKNKGWISSGDWLGTGRIANQNRVYRSFKEAREFVRALNLKTVEEWREYRKSDKKPDDIPSNPNTLYKKEWMSWGDFTGTGTIAPQDKVYRSFQEAREFVRALNLKNQKEWDDYCKSGNKPDDIPANSKIVYQKDFKGIANWLGTEWRSFKEAREFVRSLGLKTGEEWTEYCKSGDKPDDIPVTPWNVYREWNKK